MSERLSFRDEIASNKRKSIFLMIIVFAVFIALGYVIALVINPGAFFIIMIFAIIFSTLYTVVTYYNADKIAIASVGARKASNAEFREYHNIVEGLCIAAGLPKPRLFVMDSDQINAFASGRDPEHAVICVTTGCLEKLDKRELEGVLAHELAHVANFDIRFMTLTTIMVGLIAIVAQIFLRSLWFGSTGGDRRDGRMQIILLVIAVIAAILAPLIANMISLAISRKREFTADATAVKFTRYSPGLKGALEKIKHDHVGAKDKKHYSAAMAPLFISDPFKKKVRGLFSTHPPVEQRISRLERM